MEYQDKNNFQTFDFSLAIYLFAKGIILLGLRQIANTNRFLFVFQKSKNINSLIQEFWSGQAKIEPLKLFSAERELKKRLYSDSYKFIRSDNVK
ncbi:hypothetical protein A2767_03640 [Candidatus Roizmanbacteria bacterium RIFCSPHIGHO2_01_FULL_35_10]|uniref:DUF5659 domain-containing protein n=1 Tax=Candidatus Roizmanbacteria bacterium RIFCSPLOWO2_01_FULL_35_13 TaxID=1802055 RepID=A0A1F7IA30_9BACT|nr:MAG: hypothetical protein A2767_03640 [Candidatus Roizmanbacteria bacterium RIFCSPHIGHO2_01_FULL_35_10]OGK40218.1 MAG: hypothetical protein A3A74_06955 [Candidatus Roizmanbacteria bacterium RIFCSPLOWO2_01_FULL_35_13]